MRFFKPAVFLFLLNLVLSSCTTEEKKKVDEIFYNGTVYTVDSSFTTLTAFAVADGKIVATGTDEEILALDCSKKINLNGRFVYPGFHDGHCHFYGFGLDLNKINLAGTNSFNDVIDTIKLYRDRQIGGWIFARGWDQNDWEVKQYPEKSVLDSLFPDAPVFLLRIDGHAALANSEALKRSGITNSTTIEGGVIEKKNGELTGILIDRGVDLVYNNIPPYDRKLQVRSLLEAQDVCFEAGLTMVTDAGFENMGLKKDIIGLIDSLQKTGDLKMRVNAMGSFDELDYYKANGKINTPYLKVNGFKVYSDGSLGSRGACLLQPYDDQSGHYGTLVYSPAYLDSIAGLIAVMNFQMNTHCIGDSAQRLMLQIYEKYIQDKPDARWRIEHAQVISPDDYVYYKRNHILPSVQPTHATSDMYWAKERIGSERILNAYAYKTLLEQNNILIGGSDFPVESIRPLYGIYAAVARKDKDNYPEGGFQPQNALTREQALRAFTIWPAYGAFSEKETGSIEPGKNADFIVTSKDIMTIPEREIYDLKIDETYINGKPVFQRPE